MGLPNTKKNNKTTYQKRTTCVRTKKKKIVRHTSLNVCINQYSYLASAHIFFCKAVRSFFSCHSPPRDCTKQNSTFVRHSRKKHFLHQSFDQVHMGKSAFPTRYPTVSDICTWSSIFQSPFHLRGGGCLRWRGAGPRAIVSQSGRTTCRAYSGIRGSW